MLNPTTIEPIREHVEEPDAWLNLSYAVVVQAAEDYTYYVNKGYIKDGKLTGKPVERKFIKDTSPFDIRSAWNWFHIPGRLERMGVPVDMAQAIRRKVTGGAHV